MSHSQEELNQKINAAKKQIEIGSIYFHYKSPDKYYVIESIGILESSEELCVVYRALYDKGIVWVRTLENFTEVTNQGPRFTKVE